MIRKLAILALFIAVVIVSGSFWYVRNIYYKNNPVYPLNLVFRGEVIARGIPDPKYNSDQFPGHHIPEEIRDRLENDKWGTILDGFRDPWRAMAESSKLGGYGAVLCVVALPCLAFTLVSSPFRRRWDVLAFIACFFISFALFPFPTWGRFAMPHLIPLLVCIGYTLEALDNGIRRSNKMELRNVDTVQNRNQ